MNEPDGPRVVLPTPPPPRYRIVVSGSLDSNWSERLGGMTLIPHVEASGTSTTELIGPLDQAALMGVLQRLFAYGAFLLSLEYVPPLAGHDG